MENRNSELKYLYKHEDYTSQNINQRINNKSKYIKNWIEYENN